MRTEIETRDCTACGFPMRTDAERCPRCGVSPAETAASWRHLRLLMLIGTIIIVVTSLAVYIASLRHIF